MGYETIAEYISADHMPEAQRRAREARSYPRLTAHDELVAMGISEWRASGDAYGSPPMLGHAKVLPLTSSALALRSAQSVHDLDTGTVVPVAAQRDVIQRTKKLVVEVSQDEASVVLRNQHDGFRILANAGVENVAHIESITASKLRKPQAKATPGALVTKYFLTDSAGNPVETAGRSYYPLTPVLYDSLAAAKAAGVALMSQSDRIDSLEVQSHQVREESGESQRALAVITRPEQTVKITFTFQQETVKPGAQPEQYLVFFSVHS